MIISQDFIFKSMLRWDLALWEQTYGKEEVYRMCQRRRMYKGQKLD